MLEVHLLRLAAIERQHIDTKAGLQWRKLKQLIEHDLGHCIAFDLNNNADTVTVGFITQIRNAFDLLVTHTFRHNLDHAGFIDLIRHLGDDDGFPVLAEGLDMSAPAHPDRAAPSMKCLQRAGAAKNNAAGWKIRGRNVIFNQLVDGDFRVINHRAAGINDLAEIMRWNIGCHANSNTAGAVDQQIWKLRRQHGRLTHAVVIIGLEIDGVFIDVFDQRMGGTGQAGLGIPHCRCPVTIH